MRDSQINAPDSAPDDTSLEHPRGTLVIIIIFGLFFALAWFGAYLLLFLQRGAPHSH